MSLKSRDIEELENKPFQEPPFTRCFVAAIKLLAKIPPVKRYLKESVGGLSGRIFHCLEINDYENATLIAIHALEKYRNRKSRFLPYMDHHHWWSFMKYGVDSAKHIKKEELQEKLLELANAGMEPFEGYSVAYPYLEFSRWKYRAGSYGDAIKYAEMAAQADDTWAEPNFILGWYGLLLSTGDAEEQLSRAIAKDPRALFRIVNNDVCRKYPHIINKLKAKYHVSETQSGPNELKC